MIRSRLTNNEIYANCEGARVTIKDGDIICYGLYSEQTEIHEKCLKCKAYIFNAKNIKEKGTPK